MEFAVKMLLDYHVRVVRDEQELSQLEEPWTRLLDESGDGSIFASFAWNMAWWQAFGAANRLYVVVAADAAGQVRGIAPLMLQETGSQRKLVFIGHGLSDSGDFVLPPTDVAPVAHAIFAYLHDHRREWDLLDLDEVPPYTRLATWLQIEKMVGLRLIQLPRTDSPFITIPASWEAYTRALSRKPRYHLETYTRRFVEETGAAFRVITAEADAPAAVARFYRLHLARWAAKPDALNPEHRDPNFAPFLENACRRAARAGTLRLAELHVGDDAIASWISFQVTGRWNGYMTGFDPAWSNWRPGKILHGFVMRQALAEGARELDFGRGAEDYKYELGATNRKTWRFVLANSSPRSALAFALTGLRIQGRDLVRASGVKALRS
jgi:CelD/BcsL family acetyltransferase involved in cellulose biosynthesis